MDPYLANIVAAAEQERWLPVLRVVAGNTLYVGTPGPSKAYREKVEYAISEEHYSARRVTKKKAEAQYHESTAHGEQIGAHLAAAIGGAATGPVLTLLDCQVWPASGGDGIQVAAVRIPLDAVDGWWPGSGKVLKAPQKGGGWLFGFGAFVPVDIS